MSGTAQTTNKLYLAIGVWLAVLMLLGVGLAELPAMRAMFSKPAVVWIVLALSTIKAALVGWYYMHLKFDRPWLTAIAVFPLVVIACAVLLVLSSRLITL